MKSPQAVMSSKTKRTKVGNIQVKKTQKKTAQGSVEVGSVCREMFKWVNLQKNREAFSIPLKLFLSDAAGASC